MIRKLRLKFVGICMLLVTAVLAAVLLVNFMSLKRNVEGLSTQVLHRVMQEPASPIGPSLRKPPCLLPKQLWQRPLPQLRIS